MNLMNNWVKIILILLSMPSKGSEAIVNAMLNNALSNQILPLIAAASPEELNRESDIFLPLELACSKGREDLIKALVESGANVDKANRRNKTPLRIALSSYRGPCDFPIIAYLLSKGADPRDYRHSAPAVKALLDQARSQGQSQRSTESIEETHEKHDHEHTARMKVILESTVDTTRRLREQWNQLKKEAAGLKQQVNDFDQTKNIIAQQISLSLIRQRTMQDEIDQLQLKVESVDQTTPAITKMDESQPCSSPVSYIYNIQQENIHNHDNRQCCGLICRLFLCHRCCRQCNRPCENMHIKGCSIW